jgi:hypothetical protein
MGRVGRPLSVCSGEAEAIMRDEEIIPALPPLAKGGCLPAPYQHGSGPAGRQGGI